LVSWLKFKPGTSNTSWKWYPLGQLAWLDIILFFVRCITVEYSLIWCSALWLFLTLFWAHVQVRAMQWTLTAGSHVKQIFHLKCTIN
jgi:hypothetical protein